MCFIIIIILEKCDDFIQMFNFMFNTYLYLEIIKLKLLTALVARLAIPRSELVDLILGGQLEHTVHTGLDNLGGKVA